MSDSPAAIELTDVRVSYGDVPVFRGTSMRVAAGEFLGIIGPNGSGKTTLLKLLVGLITPQAGSVKLFGYEAHTREGRLQVGYVPQRIAQQDTGFPATVQEVVESGRTALLPWYGRLTKRDTLAVDRALAATDLTDLRHRRVMELSGGQRQRAFIARALAGQPRMLILDEPTVGVDAASQQSFFTFLEHLNKQEGITVVFVSHDTHALMRSVTCVLCLQDGDLCHCNLQDLTSPDHLEHHLHGDLTHHAHRHA